MDEPLPTSDPYSGKGAMELPVKQQFEVAVDAGPRWVARAGREIGHAWRTRASLALSCSGRSMPSLLPAG